MDSQAITTKDGLETILLDESMEAKALSLSLLERITNSFSNEREIGRGGFAVVYKGVLDYGEVAVKKLSKTNVDEDIFIGEVGCLMKAKHKNIVRFLGYCSDTQGKMVEYNGKPVMADVRQMLLCFEYVPNGSLHEHIKDASREWGKCFKIIKEVCEGLHYLHKEKIVHLDLKPANILLDYNMVPKITDFGISRHFGELETHVVTEKFVGTRGYVAPEVYDGKITFKSDIFSLGITITEILTANKYYPEVEEVQEHWSHKLEESKREVHLKQMQVHLEQMRVCTEVAQSCLQYNPEDRPSAQAIIDILKQTEIEVRRIDSLRQTETERRRIEAGLHVPISHVNRYNLLKKVMGAIPIIDPNTLARRLKMSMHAIHKMYAGDSQDLSFEELHKYAYTLVLHKKGEELYSAVEAAMASQVQSLCSPLAAAAAAPDRDRESFLQELVARWDRHIRAVEMIRDVFMYMDRTFVPTNHKTPIRELGLRLWRDAMASSSKIRPRLIEAVKRQRGGEDELVPGVNEMLGKLGAHVEDLPCLCFKDDSGVLVAGP